ncbi:phosphotransferase family protein [Micromonospora sp. NPDC050417]|uniref:phosphotransferase family protein n=1 Tax=Micromonospora sp. NPDC050417 TaxID=3364280 RepID=UPI003792A9B0
MTDDLPGLDLESLERYLDRARPELVQGPLRATRIHGGMSNLTYLVTDGVTRWVIRRPPMGHLSDTAHDMRREYRVIDALRRTKVPVPPPVLLCEDPAVLGAPFQITGFVDGTAHHHVGTLEAVGPVRTRRIMFQLVETLADLHAVDFAEVGLADHGRVGGFLQRQMRRWNRHLDAAPDSRPAGIDRLSEALTRAIPATSSTTIVHGDYRLGNVLVDDAGGTGIDQITALLDWEMSTLGDPLTDLGLMILHTGLSASGDRPASAVPGHPAVEDLLKRYAIRSGRDLDAMSWYIAFSAFKLAVVLEGVQRRSTEVTPVTGLIPVLIEYGLTTVRR